MNIVDTILGFAPALLFGALFFLSFWHYHVFRASEYAHNLQLKADGTGSHTSGYCWPAAFIREFIASSKAHMWQYYAIAVLWLAVAATSWYGSMRF